MATSAATFFGILLLGGGAGLIAALTHPSTRAALADSAHALAATVATGATAGSLYFSESAGFVPCELCWYQRIAMYPLAALLVAAAFRRDRAIRPYAIALATIGLAIAVYHVQLQLFPDQSSVCELTNPCTGKWVEAFGWMTIPQMAALSFTLVLGLLYLSPTSTSKEAP